MKGKLLRGITGSVQPRRLLHGYQDAVFAWSGENPFANLAQSNLYRILPRAEYKNDWIKSTPYGQAFRANNYSDSGHGYVFSRHVPNAAQTYAAGVTGYAEFVYSANIKSNEYVQHLCCISSSADGNTGDTHNGVLTFGLENHSGACPIFRVGNNATLYGFVGGSSDDNNLVPVTIPIGTKVRQLVTFNPVSKAYASILTFNDVVYERFGTVPKGFASTGSSILVGGYPRYGVRAAHMLGMLEAAIWNRGMPPAEMRALLQQPSIFQSTEFIFPFSFGESPGGGPIYASGDGTSTGTSSATGIGETVASSVATVAGIGIVTGYSAVTKAMVGNSTGISVVAATSSSGSTESGVATSTGASTVTGVVQALASSIGTATGNSVSTGVSTVAISRAGVSAGSSTVTGYGTTGDIRNGIGSSTGISTVTATGEWSVVATGSSNGISTVSGNSASIRATTGTSIATATVTGISSTSTVKLGMGSSAGLSVVDGISNSILYRTGIGSSIGSSTAIGYITYDVSNSAAAHGIATVNGVGYALIPPPLPEESRHVPGLTLELSLDKTGLNISV